jgi:hypothetical protein
LASLKASSRVLPLIGGTHGTSPGFAIICRHHRSRDWTNTGAKFYTDAQRKEVQDLFRAGQDFYRRLIR